MSDVYRQAASLLVLRGVSAEPGSTGPAYEVLLLHKQRRRDSWQIPQGGIEKGETVEEAAIRELHEEAGLTGCRIIGLSPKLYQYEFPQSFRRFRPDNVKGQQIRFIYAMARDNAKVHVDGKEINGHVWVPIERVGKYIRRKEYLQLINDLYGEAMELL